MKKVEVGIACVHLLWDLLHILKDKDYQVLRDYGFESEIEEGYMEEWINYWIDEFCEPLIEYDKDTEIILED